MHSSETLSVTRLTPDGAGASERLVAAEVPIAVSFFGIGYAVMMATPGDLHDFAVGFARSERLIESASEVLEVEQNAPEAGEGVLLSVELAADRRDLVFERVRHRIG